MSFCVLFVQKSLNCGRSTPGFWELGPLEPYMSQFALAEVDASVFDLLLIQLIE